MWTRVVEDDPRPTKIMGSSGIIDRIVSLERFYTKKICSCNAKKGLWSLFIKKNRKIYSQSSFTRNYWLGSWKCCWRTLIATSYSILPGCLTLRAPEIKITQELKQLVLYKFRSLKYIEFNGYYVEENLWIIREKPLSWQEVTL